MTSSYSFRYVFEPLGRQFRTIALDLPGSGSSPPPATVPSGYRVRRLAEEVALALLEVRPACAQWLVIGNSLGGWVGAWLAIEQKIRVNRLLLADSAGLEGSESLRGAAAAMLAEPTVESLKEFQRRAYFKPREIPEDVWKEIARRAREKGNSGDVLAAQTPDDYLDDQAERIRVPTVVFFGAADRIVPPAQGRKLAAKIPGAVFHEEPRCGHLPQKECPRALIDAANDLIRLTTKSGP
jgi:pimeloyl-ACP methyl ester carboxylesterase